MITTQQQLSTSNERLSAPVPIFIGNFLPEYSKRCRKLPHLLPSNIWFFSVSNTALCYQLMNILSLIKSDVPILRPFPTACSATRNSYLENSQQWMQFPSSCVKDSVHNIFSTFHWTTFSCFLIISQHGRHWRYRLCVTQRMNSGDTAAEWVSQRKSRKCQQLRIKKGKWRTPTSFSSVIFIASITKSLRYLSNRWLPNVKFELIELTAFSDINDSSTDWSSSLISGMLRATVRFVCPSL